MLGILQFRSKDGHVHVDDFDVLVVDEDVLLNDSSKPQITEGLIRKWKLRHILPCCLIAKMSSLRVRSIAQRACTTRRMARAERS